MNTPTLDNDEIYVATIQIAGQAPYHLEQALLFTHQREQFDRDWYWSNSLHESRPDYAWYQYFGSGDQGYGHIHLYKLRARAVRREYF